MKSLLILTISFSLLIPALAVIGTIAASHGAYTFMFVLVPMIVAAMF